MNINHINNDTIRWYIPNVLREVKGENTLYNKLVPYLDTERAWLEQNLLGDVELTEAATNLATRVIVAKSLMMAIPSLDLVVTPTGLAVVSTSELAPASKERVERLIASLDCVVYDNLVELSREMFYVDGWTSSPVGQEYCSTLFQGLFAVQDWHKKGADPFVEYSHIRELTTRFEAKIAEDYLGYGVMNELRSIMAERPQRGGYWLSWLRAQLVPVERWLIRRALQDDSLSCPDEHQFWHPMRHIIARMKSYPEIYRFWAPEMAERFDPDDSLTKTKGGVWL